ncbi:MAG: FAD-dependent thymidylate synthase [DPANN group archaeon]|nr:FAD-dependent thymidylate synthase [DPANN group archaeon]
MALENFTEQERQILSKYVTNLDSDVYCVKNLPEEVVAVLFAYVSRSNNTFRQNLLKLLGSGEISISSRDSTYSDDIYSEDATAKAKKTAKEFHEKWVVGYGHASVAEHADVKIAIDSLSNVATKMVEHNRLGRYTEKSSRYVKFSKDNYYTPPKIARDESFSKKYKEACDHLLDTYDDLYDKIVAYVMERMPQEKGVSDGAYKSSVKAKTCDVVRYLLPASTITSVGVSMNARALAYSIKQLLSSPLEEFQELGQKIKTEAELICPALLKYAEFDPMMHDVPLAARKLADFVFVGTEIEKPRRPVELVHYDKDVVDKIAASILYKHSNLPYHQVYERVQKMSSQEKEKIFDTYHLSKGKFNIPLEEFEHGNFTFDMIMDFGAFRDVQRHRTCIQSDQLITADHGYDTPEDIIKAGCQKQYQAAMEKAAQAYNAIRKKYPHEAQYVVPNGYRKRVLITWDLRGLENFIRLRSSPHGHESYRRIAQQTYDELARISPLLVKYLSVDKNEYYLGRLKSEVAKHEKIDELKKKYGEQAVVTEGNQ